MPKRSRKKIETRTNDINEIAHQLVQRSTETPSNIRQSAISQIMAEMGRKGGKKGGKSRAAKMTAEERSKSASQAARARWGNGDGGGS